MFISPAYAQGADAGATLTSLLPLVLIFVVFYMLLIRPQQKKMKQHRNMVANLRRGDKVVTAGGLLGHVTKVVNDNELMVELAEGVRVRVVKATISEVLSKTEPAGGKQGGGAANDDSGGSQGGRPSRRLVRRWSEAQLSLGAAPRGPTVNPKETAPRRHGPDSQVASHLRHHCAGGRHSAGPTQLAWPSGDR